jgi:cytochrome P450
MTTRTWTVEDIQLGEPDFWELPRDERDAAFALLRRESPVTFHREGEFSPGFPMGPGFWSVVRHSDVRMVGRQAQRFSSASGITVLEQTSEMDELFGSMINADDPRHARLRLLIQRGFTPKAIAQLEQSVRERAQRLVADAAETGGGDFVEMFAAPFPLQIICDMMGIPPADERRVFEITNVILGPGDPDLNLDFAQFMSETQELYDYAVELGKDRLANPRDDIATTLMQAEVDGERLELEDFARFMILLAAAGNETTRNAISHGMKLLTDNPDQRQIWVDDFAAVAPTAVDEIVRVASPVLHMRRLTTEDVEIAGQPIGAGEKVVMWYYSANRDETVFSDPLRFDVRRKAEQVGYGGGGPHFCLGANLARREMTVMFEEVFQTLPDLHITGEPEMLRSNFIHGIKKMPCEFTPVSAG